MNGKDITGSRKANNRKFEGMGAIKKRGVYGLRRVTSQLSHLSSSSGFAERAFTLPSPRYKDEGEAGDDEPRACVII